MAANDERTLHIPAFLSYECQTCGGCCRDYEIAMSEEKHLRLSRVDWRRISDEVQQDVLFEPSVGEWVGGPYRFALRSDGSCVFLCRDNKCLIHRHLGFEAKALACQLFPLTFASTPSGVYVGGRFNCRAITEARGEPMEKQRGAIGRLCEEYRLSGSMVNYPERVAFDGGQQLSWPDYLKVEQAMVNLILSPEAPLLRRAAAVWRLADLMRGARLEKVRGARFSEFIAMVSPAMLDEIEDEGLPAARPGAAARRLFDQFLFFLHHRQGGSQRTRSLGQSVRLRLEGLLTSLKFSFRVGRVRLFADGPSVRLKDVGKVPFAGFDEVSTAVMERYIAGKLFGKQVFGPLFFNYKFLDGLAALFCACAAILWYARGAALSRGAARVEPQDLMRAVEHVDFSFGHSPSPLLWTERTRIRFLSLGQMPARLLVWQARSG